MAKKVDHVNEIMNKTESDRDRFMEACQAAEARYFEHNHDTEEEVRQRKIMEKDYITIQQKYSDLVIKNEGMTDNANLDKL